MWVDVLQHTSTQQLGHRLAPIAAKAGVPACACHGAYNEGTVLSDCVCAHETRALMKGNGVQLQRVRNPKSISCFHVKALKAACQ